jgi:adenosylcobyric acid synthase
VVRFIESPSEVNTTDLVVLPGTKTTLADLAFLRASGFAAAILARVTNGGPVLGICGGCQMLGQTLADPLATESTTGAEVQGLGLLQFHTLFEPTKRTTQIEFKGSRRSLLCDELDAPLVGYEIHMGRLHGIQGDAAFRIQDANGDSESRMDGAVSANGLVVGSMIHGLFDNEPVRRALLRQLRERRGLSAATFPSPEPADVDEYDRLAETLSKHLDMPRLLGLIGQ